MEFQSLTYKISSVLTGLACIAFTSASLATDYQYHPNSTFTLGRGFEPNTLIEPKLNCLSFKRKLDIENGAATSTVLSMHVVDSVEKLKKVLGVDFSVDARYLQSKANTSFNLNVNSQFNSNSVNVLILAQSEFGTTSMEEPRLVKRAADLIKNGNHDVFRKECGSQLVTNEILGVKIATLLTIKNLHSSVVSDFKTNNGFNSDNGAMSVDIKLKLSDLVNRSVDSGSVQISIYSTGSQGVKDLEGIVSSLTVEKDSLTKIQNELGKYMSKFSVNNAVPIVFVAKPFDFGFENNFENLWKSHYETKIKRIAYKYKELDYKVSVAKEIFNRTDLRHIMFNSQDVQNLYRQAQKIEDYLDDLVELHRNCQNDVYSQLQTDKVNRGKNGSYCKFDETKVPKFDLPELPEVPVLQANAVRFTQTDLELRGNGIREILVVYSSENDERIIESFKFEMPNALEAKSYPISLARYWGFRSTHVAGPLYGKIIVKDYFGRTMSHLFHVALYPDKGATKPYLEKFEPAGIEDMP